MVKSQAEPPRIVLIGGGTGSFTLLQELKKLTPHISAIVNMSDDGGSTGVLRDELGVLPPGDVRQCLVALSDSQELRDLFTHRFDKGSLAGQSLGNLILAGLEEQHGSFEKAIEVVSDVLQIHGQVIPVSLESHTLVMHDGAKVVRGEFKIGHRTIKNKDARLELDPAVGLNPKAERAISEADLVVIAPGNVYCSLLPAMIVEGMAEALQNTSATKILLANLVTMRGQTDGWHVVDYVHAFERYIGTQQINFVVYNTALPSKELLKRYAKAGEFPVAIEPARFKETSAKPVGAALVADQIFQPSAADKAVPRTYIRHDAKTVCKLLQNLLKRI